MIRRSSARSWSRPSRRSPQRNRSSPRRACPSDMALAVRGTPERQAEIFRRQAAYCDGRSPLYAELCRRLAEDPRVDDIAPDLVWDFPLRLLGGLHYLVLAGEASWDDIGAALDQHRE